MKLRLNKDKIGELLIFLLLFVSSSFVITNNIISSTATIALWILFSLIVIVSMIAFRTRITLGFQSPVAICMILLLCIWISDIINHENLMTTGKITSSFIAVSFFVFVISYDDFKREYCRVMFVLSSISLCLFGGYQIFPALKGVNVVRNATGFLFSNLYIFVYNLSVVRNCGMFWEPGAFGSFLCLAILFELMAVKPKVNYLIVFFFAVITTFSTTAYISTVLIVLYSVFLNYGTSKRIRRILLLLMGLAVIGIFANYDLFFGRYGASTVFGKLFRYYEGTSHSQYTSTSVRVNAVIYGLRAFITSPIIGHGYLGLRELLYDYTLGMNTCTFVNWFAVYGFLFGTLMLIGYYKLCAITQNNKRSIDRWILLMVFFVITISENFVNTPVFILLCLYGFYKTDRDKCVEDNEYAKS